MKVSRLGKCQCDGRNMFLNGNTGDCEECPAGTGLYRRFNICVPCGDNCSECKTWNKCGTCEPGFTFTLGQCYADLCSRDDLLMNADGECVCKRGYTDTGSECVYCPPDEVWDSGSESCVPDEDKKCDGGAVWDPIWEECSCPDGSSFSNNKCVPDQDSWDECPENCDNCDSDNKCTTCTDTYWYDDLNNTCYCPDDYFVTNENKCIPTEECESD